MAERMRRPAKTIYVRGEDVAVWTTAEQEARTQGISLSALIVDALRAHLTEQASVPDASTEPLRRHLLTGKPNTSVDPLVGAVREVAYPGIYRDDAALARIVEAANIVLQADEARRRKNQKKNGRVAAAVIAHTRKAGK